REGLDRPGAGRLRRRDRRRDLRDRLGYDGAAARRAATAAGMTPDLVIRGGTVVDGTGAAPVAADVAVTGGAIAAIGRIEARGARELDAAGCLVTPGFIDIHSHSDFTLLVDPRAVSAVHQGVTLEVIGNCGHGCFPIRDES